MKRCVPLLLTSAIAACSAAPDSDMAADGRDDAFLGGPKADGGVDEGSPLALAVLGLVNEASFEILDDEVRLDVRAVDGIFAVRGGADGELGTDDDGAFVSLAELDAVPWVGPVAFAALKAYVEEHGLVEAASATAVHVSATREVIILEGHCGAYDPNKLQDLDAEPVQQKAAISMELTIGADGMATTSPPRTTAVSLSGRTGRINARGLRPFVLDASGRGGYSRDVPDSDSCVSDTDPQGDYGHTSCDDEVVTVAFTRAPIATLRYSRKRWVSRRVGSQWEGVRQDTSCLLRARTAGAVVDLDAGSAHACAVLSDGGVMCWGDNTFGQLGDTTTVSRNRPQRVHGISDAVDVVAGDAHTCARTRHDEIFCWGINSSGQLGPSASDTFSPRPVQVPLSDAGSIFRLAAGMRATCALASHSLDPLTKRPYEWGDAWCWGKLRTKGVAGVHRIDLRDPLLNVGSNISITDVALTQHGLCMAKNDDTLLCRGATNDLGELGKGDRVEPVSEHHFYPVWYHEYPSSFVAQKRLRAGAAGYVVLRGGYKPWHWGSSVLSAANGVERPTPWPGVQGSRDADIHGSSACAVETSGNVRCEGLEDPDLSAAALQVGVGIGFACALTSDGVVSCWGKNDRGQAGQPAAPGAHAATPVIVTDFVSAPVEHD